MEIKVCVRTYRLFFVSGTEDYLKTRVSGDEIKDVKERLAKKEAARRLWINKILETDAEAKSALTLETSGPGTGATSAAVNVAIPGATSS